MNDIELANKVVALGIGYQGEGISIDGVGFYHTPENECGETEGLSARLFVHEPSVAMAAMERSGWCQALEHPDGYWVVNVSRRADSGNDGNSENESLNRAIVEATVEALS